jgi:hypothetical protein
MNESRCGNGCEAAVPKHAYCDRRRGVGRGVCPKAEPALGAGLYNVHNVDNTLVCLQARFSAWQLCVGGSLKELLVLGSVWSKLACVTTGVHTAETRGAQC